MLERYLRCMSSPAQILARSKGPNRLYMRATITRAAKALGSLGGQSGGPARAEALTSSQRTEIASHAAHIRWGTPCFCRYCKLK